MTSIDTKVEPEIFGELLGQYLVIPAVKHRVDRELRLCLNGLNAIVKETPRLQDEFWITSYHSDLKALVDLGLATFNERKNQVTGYQGYMQPTEHGRQVHSQLTEQGYKFRFYGE
ncbi:MAG: hypothetical protein AABX51_01590 [Nanoarchaeota archaeon]